MSSDIPFAREVLRNLLKAYRNGEKVTTQYATTSIEVALSHMTRETIKPRRARVKSDPLDAALAAQIRQYVKSNPGVSVKDAAILFNVNQGRITEALQGKV